MAGSRRPRASRRAFASSLRRLRSSFRITAIAAVEAAGAALGLEVVLDAAPMAFGEG